MYLILGDSLYVSWGSMLFSLELLRISVLFRLELLRFCVLFSLE